MGRQIETMMTSAEQKTASGTGLRLLLSIGGLVLGATGAFVSLQTALNRAWEVEPDPKRGGIKNFITKRVLSLGMVLGIAFLVLVSLALTAALCAAGGVLFGGLGELVGQVLNFVLSFAVISLLFAAMFKVLPDAKIAWRDVWVGALRVVERKERVGDSAADDTSAGRSRPYEAQVTRLDGADAVNRYGTNATRGTAIFPIEP